MCFKYNLNEKQQILELVDVGKIALAAAKTNSAKFSRPVSRSSVDGRLAAEQALERLPEFRAEDGVDDWVERGVEVAEPEEDGEHRLVKDPVGPQRHQQSADEERQPADDESARDDGQRLGRFTLTFGFKRFTLLAHGVLRRPLGRLRARRWAVHCRAVERLVPAGNDALRRRWNFDCEGRRLQLFVFAGRRRGDWDRNGRDVVAAGPGRRFVFLDVFRLFRRRSALEPAAHFILAAFFALSLVHLLLVVALPDPPPGRLEDLPVDDEDDGQRDVERGASGKDLIRDVLADEAALLDVDSVQEFRVLPAEKWCDGHDQRNRPD